MRIVCDRCRKNTVDFKDRKDWIHIEISEKVYGKVGDYYLCKKCSDAFYKFLDSEVCKNERIT